MGAFNQFAVYALTRELSTLETIEWFHRATDGVAVPQILQEMDAILQKVPARPVPAWDTLADNTDVAKE